MSPEAVIWILGMLFIIVGTVAAWLAFSFRHLRGTVYVSLAEVGELLVLIARWYKLEDPEEKAARILKMDRETLKLEIERGNLMMLIARRAEAILATLKSAVPDAGRLIHDIEDDFCGDGRQRGG
jgi:hypothetical protein